MKMTHRRSLALLGDYAADELTSTAYQALTAHLQTCAICRKNLMEIEQIRTRLRSFALPVAPFGQRNAAFSPFSEQQAWNEGTIVPGQMVGVEHRPSARRPIVLLAAALIACSLLLSIATVITVTAFQSHSGAQPHLIPTPHPQKHCSAPSFPQGGTCALPTPVPTPAPIPTPSPLNPGHGQVIETFLRTQHGLIAVQMN